MRFFSNIFKPRHQQRIDAGRVYQPNKFVRVDDNPPKGFWSLIRRVWDEPTDP